MKSQREVSRDRERFSMLSRTELYALANALWWASMDNAPGDKTKSQWLKLENEIRATAYRKSNGNAIAAGVRKSWHRRLAEGRSR